jgi:hypothetical protein
MSDNTKNSSKSEPSEAYLIEKEKQKTTRMRNMYIFFGIVIIAAIIAIYFIVGKGGKGGIDVDITKGKFAFTVDKPVVEQAKTETKSFKTPEGKTIDYTTGRISQNVLNDFGDKNVAFSPKAFVGDNLINDVAGYIISSSNPGMWNVQYNPNGLNDPLTPINTLMASDGSHMNVTRDPIMFENIKDYVDASINTLFNYGIITAYPNVSYANDHKTAFLTFTNLSTNGQSYMKVIKGQSYYYVATANYNLDYTNYNTQEELIWMVANFTLIE